MRILLVEDNTDLAASLVDYLELKGHVCDLAFNGEAGLSAATSNTYDMYIFDIAMPKMDGLELCNVIRTQYYDYTPILFLTARDTLEDKIAGFAAGADDYLIKPFALSELIMRLEAIYKRYTGVKTQLQVADLQVNLKTEEVSRAHSKISLSPNTYKLLVILMHRSPEVVLRHELEYLVWGDNLPDSDSLRSHIYKLRSKIDKPFNTSLIKTAKGRGFSIS
jgi:DNA-binding response OmpR family regulator